MGENDEIEPGPQPGGRAELQVTPEHLEEMATFNESLRKLDYTGDDAEHARQVITRAQFIDAITGPAYSKQADSKGLSLVGYGLILGVLQDERTIYNVLKTIERASLIPPREFARLETEIDSVHHALSLNRTSPDDYREFYEQKITNLEQVAESRAHKGNSDIYSVELAVLAAYWSSTPDANLRAEIKRRIERLYVGDSAGES